MIMNQQPTHRDADNYSIGGSPTIKVKRIDTEKNRATISADKDKEESVNNVLSSRLVISSEKKPTTSSAAITKSKPSLGPYDILCGRNKLAYNHIGNRRFRVTINMNLQAYVNAKTRNDKAALIAYIVNYLKNEVGARFVTQRKDGSLGDLTPRQARQKVGHALRDLSVARQQQSVALSSASSARSDDSVSQEEDQQARDGAKSLIDEVSTGKLKDDNINQVNEDVKQFAPKQEQGNKNQENSCCQETSLSSWSNMFQTNDHCLIETALSYEHRESEHSLKMEHFPWDATLENTTTPQTHCGLGSQRTVSKLERAQRDGEADNTTSSHGSPRVDGLPALPRPW